uniref:Dynein heavy chain n=1 Tax=Timema bartmani TaxID=61472 RepID=A0A7R9HZP5_9NEOP|nr:unnamed protein product [Timema bartmani]
MSLEEQLAKLTADFEQASAEKQRCQQEADATNRTIQLANRLVGGLASENVRWAEAVANYMQQGTTLPGDVLLVTAFISYVGCFTKQYRLDLLNKMWLPFLKTLEVGMGGPYHRTLREFIIAGSTQLMARARGGREGKFWRHDLFEPVQREGRNLFEPVQRGGRNLFEPVQGGSDVILAPIQGEFSLPPIPITEGLDPLSLLTDDAQIAVWNNEGLPSDRMSTENATILSNSDRWPLMIDPQVRDPVSGGLQGVKWIKQKYGEALKVIRLGQRGYLDVIEQSLSSGATVLLENIGENLDPVLDTLLGRNLIKKGNRTVLLSLNFRTRAGRLRIGDKEVEYNSTFQLILQTKMANPHYKPEMQAQTTLINFTVTRDGLEDQLLAEVVKAERPDLEDLKDSNTKHGGPTPMNSVQAELTKQQNDFKIMLKSLEDDLLSRLSSAGGNILGDTALVENLETTKRTAAEIEQKVNEAKVTSAKIDQAREYYRPAAARASLLYFILNELNTINPIYQFSLKILLMNEEIQPPELDFLLRFPIMPHVTSPVDFLSNNSWGGIRSLSSRDEFRAFIEEKLGAKYVEGRTVEFAKSFEETSPSTPIFFILSPGVNPLKDVETLGKKMGFTTDEQNFHNVSLGQGQEVVAEEAMDIAAQKGHWVILQVGRAMDIAAQKGHWVILQVGRAMDTAAQKGHWVILQVGRAIDIAAQRGYWVILQVGRAIDIAAQKGHWVIFQVGRAMDTAAQKGHWVILQVGKAMDIAAQKGNWVILQNIHLVKKWLPALEKKLEHYSMGSHPDYRVFMSAEPAATAAAHIIPQGILESSIKITNEPPTGMMANLHKALDNFTQETLEMCTKEAEFKAILFTLCYFHAVVAERRKFGPQGWNKVYPFNVGDLNICVNVLYNYLEANSKVPWEDLRYLFGEIMYGGHITDDWDRRLCISYLEELMQPDLVQATISNLATKLEKTENLVDPHTGGWPKMMEDGFPKRLDDRIRPVKEQPNKKGLSLPYHGCAPVDGELQLAPGFAAPPNTDFVGYHAYIDEMMPPESPYLYGLHPNAEIGFLTTTAENLFRVVFEMQPRDAGTSGGATVTREDKKLPEEFNMAEIMGKVEERTPYVIVAFQECERMNYLTGELKRSLKELDLGLKGELTITFVMEELENSLFLDQVPQIWTQRAYPSLQGLTAWFADLLLRLRELDTWSTDFVLPSSVWLAGFFNPQSFLTAIMQSTARKNELPLDKMCLQCDVTKKQKEDFTSAPREGAYVHGLYMEGARWDSQTGFIMDSRLKELFPYMPVVNIRAITQDKQDLRNTYECPIYKTRTRGPTYVWTFNLKTKDKPAKWTLAGVALLLQT